MTKKRYNIVATCYTKSGRVISKGVNSYTKTHPIQARFAALVHEPERKYLHAEIKALLRANDRTVHTISIHNTNGLSLPYPCAVCLAAIKFWGVKKLIISANTKTL